MDIQLLHTAYCINQTTKQSKAETEAHAKAFVPMNIKKRYVHMYNYGLLLRIPVRSTL